MTNNNKEKMFVFSDIYFRNVFNAPCAQNTHSEWDNNVCTYNVYGSICTYFFNKYIFGICNNIIHEICTLTIKK